MSLRALCSLLIRRFPPRRILAAQAETIGSASGRPTRSLHNLNNPDAAEGARHASGVGVGVAGLAALAGIPYLKKDDKAGEVADEGAINVVVTGIRKAMNDPMEAALNDPAIMTMFMDKDGNIAWMEYNDYLIFRMHYLDEGRKVAVEQEGNMMKVDEALIKKRFEEWKKDMEQYYKNDEKMIMEQEYKVDEVAMKKRFEDWMEQYGRTYKDEEEKARRYEVFKMNAIKADKINAVRGGTCYGPNSHGDWTEDELNRICCHEDGFDWKLYFDDLRTMFAERRYGAHVRKVHLDELICTDAVKKRFRELAAQKAEQKRQANKH